MSECLNIQVFGYKNTDQVPEFHGFFTFDSLGAGKVDYCCISGRVVRYSGSGKTALGGTEIGEGVGGH